MAGYHPLAKYTELGGGFLLSTRIYIDGITYESFGFSATTPTTGKYNFNKNSMIVDYQGESGCKKYLIDTLNNELEIIYLDTENDIISGTFSGWFINDCQDTLKETEGRFDLEYL